MSNNSNNNEMFIALTAAKQLEHNGTMASVLIVKCCPFCKKEYQKMFPADGWRRYEAGERVQDCFPEMSADDREFLISGICPTCWDKTFGED